MTVTVPRLLAIPLCRPIVYNALMSADNNDRNRHIAELEAHAAQMEKQIEVAEKTIQQCRQTLAIMRNQIKRAMTGGDEQEFHSSPEVL